MRRRLGCFVSGMFRCLVSRVQSYQWTTFSTTLHLVPVHRTSAFHRLVTLGSPPTKKRSRPKDKKMADKVASSDFMQEIQECRLTCAKSVAEFDFDETRVKMLSKKFKFASDSKGIMYWMSRDQRVQDNWALLYAQRVALKLQVPLHICFCLVPKFLEATIRQFGFMLKGLREVEEECNQLGISFHLFLGHAKDVLPDFVRTNKIGGVVTDFSPLRVPLAWVEDVKIALPEEVPFCCVDAHNIVPCWQTSTGLETTVSIRKKINSLLPAYLTEFPPVIKHPYPARTKCQPIDWEKADASLQVDRSVKEVDWATPGVTGGLANLEGFIKKRLQFYDKDRNNVDKNGQSNMSPWFHFGQVSPARAMLMAQLYKDRHQWGRGLHGYMEQGTIRRELSDNFCFYNKKYDSLEGADDWARETLEKHKIDKRQHLYTIQQLEAAETHDDLWNAGQLQMVTQGKMHGYIRIYWAKKILEWTDCPETALAHAIYLNDKYEVDGRDPNGYTGIMWSICGIHDRQFDERPIYGAVRYVSYNGYSKKFDVPAFVRKYQARCYSVASLPYHQSSSEAMDFSSMASSTNTREVQIPHRLQHLDMVSCSVDEPFLVQRSGGYNVLRPPLVYVGGRCYRKNPIQSREYVEDDETTFYEQDTYVDEVCDAFSGIEQTSDGFRAVMEVPSAYFKYIIGKQGETKKRIENDTRTQIIIPKQGEEGEIVIKGRDSKGVRSAKTRTAILVDSARQRQPFTHFLSFPITGGNIIDSFETFKSEVLAHCEGDRGLDNTIFQNPKKLHLTLGTLVLLSEAEISKATAVLKQCQEDLIRPLLDGRPLVADIEGLEYMNDDPSSVDVLFAQVKLKDGSERLQMTADNLVDRFISTGLMQKEYDHVKLHLTVMNTLMRKDPSGTTVPRVDRRAAKDRESFDATNVLKGIPGDSLEVRDITKRAASSTSSAADVCQLYMYTSAQAINLIQEWAGWDYVEERDSEVNVVCEDKFGSYKFGTFHINALHLSQRYSTGPEGYYACASNIELP